MLKNKYLSLFLHGFFLTSYSKSVNKGQVQCLAVWGRNATSWGQSELSSRLIWTTKWNCLNVSWMPSPFRKKIQKDKAMVQRDSSVVKSANCSFRGSQFTSQNPQMAHNHLYCQQQRTRCPLLTFSGTCIHRHIPTHRQACIHINKNIFLKESSQALAVDTFNPSIREA